MKSGKRKTVRFQKSLEYQEHLLQFEVAKATRAVNVENVVATDRCVVAGVFVDLIRHFGDMPREMYVPTTNKMRAGLFIIDHENPILILPYAGPNPLHPPLSKQSLCLTWPNATPSKGLG